MALILSIAAFVFSIGGLFINAYWKLYDYSRQKANLKLRLGFDIISKNKVVSFINIIKTGKDGIFASRLIYGRFGQIKINTPLSDAPVRLNEEGFIYTQKLIDVNLVNCDYIYILDTLGNIYSVDRGEIDRHNNEYKELLDNPPVGYNFNV
jgi:hypothetical protein